MRHENLFQEAIRISLQEQCKSDGIEYRDFPPANSQQGVGDPQYCADFLAVLDNSVLHCLEIKELKNGELIEFRPEQHEDLLAIEAKGLPVAYAYYAGTQRELPTHDRQGDWAERTLKATKYSKPSTLKTKKPDQLRHRSLLEVLAEAKREGGTSNFATFGRLLPSPIRPHLLKNWFLTYLYSPGENATYCFTPDQMRNIYTWMAGLNNYPTSHQIRSKLEKIMSAAEIPAASPALTSIPIEIEEDHRGPSP